MEIQSLSVVVPTKPCMNNCPFCVSKMHDSIWAESVKYKKYDPADRRTQKFQNKMAFARDNGCNTMMITGTAEPIQNKDFLLWLGDINKRLEKPFRWIEFQTTGVMLYQNETNLKILHDIGVDTISISVANMFDDVRNMEIMEVPEKARFELYELSNYLKDNGFNIRLSLNMTDEYQVDGGVLRFFKRAKELGADQITFRQMFYDESKPVKDLTEEEKWVKKHLIDPELIKDIQDYIKKKGKANEKLPFGAIRYSVDDMSVVLDDDCMSEEAKYVIKYLVLRPDGNIYTKWNDVGSKLF